MHAAQHHIYECNTISEKAYVLQAVQKNSAQEIDYGTYLITYWRMGTKVDVRAHTHTHTKPNSIHSLAWNGEKTTESNIYWFILYS